ncbi:sensor histidine kinase [Alloscardovia sp. HMSC034E08]|uniref:sensor histidine kinase n=1 Tax=Alloscardovia sp. HMSC034E08 TaxID=1739413 RepID=UPI0008BCD99E|nr:histidine kinase [Alloscardovia sp. HMSC034E08]OFQ96965.1 hypothetical protein HMPREF2909_01035 [Alloscardovia sp. HMSC034E08]
MKDALTDVHELERYRTKGRRLGMFFASVWVLFLIIPLYYAFAFPPASLVQQIALVLDIVCIAPVFLYGSIHLNVLNPARNQSIFQAVAVLALLFLLTVGAVVLGGDWGYLTCINFFIGCALHILPLRVSIGTFIVTLALFELFSHTVSWQQGTSYIIVMLIWVAVALLGRYSDENTQRIEHLKKNAARMEERERAASNIHDLLGQSLTAINLKAQLLEATSNDPNVQKEARELQQIAVDGIDQMHRAVADMRSSSLNAELEQTRSLCSSARIQLDIRGEVSTVPERYEAVSAQAVHESVTNVLRHAQAHRLRITVSESAVHIEDDGIGFPRDIYQERTDGSGTGLAQLREKARAAGARLECAASELGGALVRVEFDAN